MFEIIKIEGRPNREEMGEIAVIYEKVFGAPPKPEVLERFEEKEGFLTLLALNHEKMVVGCKIGYKLEEGIYYSWLGGILPAYRGVGIATLLMQAQHDWCREKGYTKVRTKTMNRWRNMLILNLKTGFDIVQTYPKNGELRIVLEKKL